MRQHPFFEALEALKELRLKNNGALIMDREQTELFLSWLSKLITQAINAESLLKELAKQLESIQGVKK